MQAQTSFAASSPHFEQTNVILLSEHLFAFPSFVSIAEELVSGHNSEQKSVILFKLRQIMRCRLWPLVSVVIPTFASSSVSIKTVDVILSIVFVLTISLFITINSWIWFSFYLQEFDTTYGPAWHCIVGTSFGSYVTHSLGGFLYFSVDKAYILLFRTAVEPLSHP
jgi:hypothetical protein